MWPPSPTVVITNMPPPPQLHIVTVQRHTPTAKKDDWAAVNVGDVKCYSVGGTFFIFLFIIHEFILLKQFVRSHPVLPPSKTAVDGSPSGPGGKKRVPCDDYA